MIGVVLGMIFPVVFNGLFFYLKGVHNSIVAWVAFAMINCSYVTMLAMIKNRKRGEAGLLH